jgi:hypothetical protein
MMAQRHTLPDTLPLPLEGGPVNATTRTGDRTDAVLEASARSFSPPVSERQSPASLETAFTQLLGRKATPQEIAELHRIRTVLNLQDNDALWLIVLSLDYYRQEIEKSVYESLKHVQATAKSTVEQVGKDYLRQLFPTLLAKATDQANANALGFNGSMIITGVIALITLVVVGMGVSAFLSYHLGEQAGQKQCLLTHSPSTPPQPLPPLKGRSR